MQFWTVTGRAILDEDFRTDLFAEVNGALNTAQLGKLHGFLTGSGATGSANTYNLSLWQTAEINRVVHAIQNSKNLPKVLHRLSAAWGTNLPSDEMLSLIGILTFDLDLRSRYQKAILRGTPDVLALTRSFPYFPTISGLECDHFAKWFNQSTVTRLEKVEDAWVFPQNTNDVRDLLNEFIAIEQASDACSVGVTLLTKPIPFNGGGEEPKLHPYLHTPQPLIRQLWSFVAKDDKGEAFLKFLKQQTSRA